MPYILPHRREEFTVETVGDLNYQIHQLIDKHLPEIPGYTEYNGVFGVLEAIKLELWSRLLATYEDMKKMENGDCAPYTRLQPTLLDRWGEACSREIEYENSRRSTG